MRSILPGLLAILLLTVVSCRKDDITTTKDIIPPTPTVKIETSVHGMVFDENQNPVVDATVQMGDEQVQTNEQGYFQLSDLQSSDRALVYVTKAGYFDAYPVFTPNEGSREFLEIQLIERQLTASISAEDGGTVSTNGSEVIFAPGSFVLENGDAYTGQVQVYAHYLDPTDEKLYQYMPGNLTAVNVENEIQVLITYGMINVELETPSGESLNIDQDAILNMPVPNELMANAPQIMPLWYYDGDLGLWVEEGQATLSGNTYSGTVSHFTFWNCDIPSNFVQINGQVNVSGFSPRVEVRLTRLDNGDTASDYTDDKGLFDGKVPLNQVFLMEIINSCGTVIHSEQIGPFSADTYVGTFAVTTTAEFSQVSGTVTNCDGAPTSGYVITSTGQLLSTGSNGVFNNLLATCGDSELSLTAVDLVNQVQSDAMVYTVEPVMNIGTIQACGNMIVSGVNYEINGGTSIFIPFCTVLKTDDPSNFDLYEFINVYEESPGNKVETKYTIANWTGDPLNPLWALSYEHTFTGTVSQYWSPGTGDISLVLENDTPGGIIRFEISNADVTEEISGTTYAGSVVSLIGIVQ